MKKSTFRLDFDISTTETDTDWHRPHRTLQRIHQPKLQKCTLRLLFANNPNEILSFLIRGRANREPLQHFLWSTTRTTSSINYLNVFKRFKDQICWISAAAGLETFKLSIIKFGKFHLLPWWKSFIMFESWIPTWEYWLEHSQIQTAITEE